MPLLHRCALSSKEGLAPLSLFSDINETWPEADSFADSGVDRVWAHD